MVYALLVKSDEKLQCLEKWKINLDVDIDAKVIFSKLLKTTDDACLRWFQYRLLHRILPTGRLLFLQRMVDSPLCTFCNLAEETLMHLFWHCPHVQKFWLDVQEWLHTNFAHCNDVIFSEELIILGTKENVITDRIIDLFILLAKYHIFTSKVKGTLPFLNIFVYNVKNRYMAEKYENAVNNRYCKKFSDWLLYGTYFLGPPVL